MGEERRIEGFEEEKQPAKAADQEEEVVTEVQTLNNPLVNR